MQITSSGPKGTWLYSNYEVLLKNLFMPLSDTPKWGADMVTKSPYCTYAKIVHVLFVSFMVCDGCTQFMTAGILITRGDPVYVEART